MGLKPPILAHSCFRFPMVSGLVEVHTASLITSLGYEDYFLISHIPHLPLCPAGWGLGFLSFPWACVLT